MLTQSTSSASRLIALLLALALLATACGGGSDSSASDTGSDDNSAEVDTGSSDADSGDTDAGAMDDDDAMDDETADTVEVIEDEPSDAGPVSGGSLRYILEADVDGINPVTSALSAPGLMMANAVFDTLVVMDVDDNWHPYLAESFTPNDDFTSWTMKLREGVEFHDGTPLNSEAIRIGFETVIADPLVGLAVAPFYPAVEDGALEIVDDYTVVYNLLDPNANFPTALTGALGFVPSPTWLAAALEDPTLNQQPVGTGPFVFDGRSEDSVTRFVRNENWWNGAAYLDAIEFVPVTDPNTRNDLFFQGEAQALHTTTQENILDLRETDGVQNVLDDSGEEFFVMINASKAPFDDIRARQALTFATPRQNFLDLIALGLSQPADQMFTPSSPYYVDGVVQEADNPDAATPLVAEFCAEVADQCADGKINMELQWSGPSVIQTRIAELLDQGWSDHFNVTFQELPQDAHIQEVAFGLYDVATWRQFGAINPADDRVWLICKTIGGLSLNCPATAMLSVTP